MLRNAVLESSAETVIIPALRRGVNQGDDAGESAEESATYLFELLVAARRLAVTRRHKFLAYLIGMAAEEARLLTQGKSAVRKKVA
ncbi:MAG: hypothetical protein ACOH12_02710 [Parvibaculaceae bacterium]